MADTSAPRRSGPLPGYALALLAVGAGVITRALLDPFLGDSLPFIMFFLSVLVTAWYAGRGPALLATVLSWLAVDWFFIPPRGTFALPFGDIPVVIGALTFFATAAGTALIGGSMRDARRIAEARALEAEAREQALAEAIREQASVGDKLTLARARLGVIVESSDDAIVAKDLEGTITDWNPAAQRLFGYTREEALGRPITMLLPPERLAEEPKILATFRRGERIDHFETERVTKSGERVYVSISVSPIVDARGRVVGAAKIARDIGAWKAGEAERERLLLEERSARQEAEAASRAKDAFLATVSHELRTPLSPIIAWARMLRERKLDEGKVRKGLETIERNARAQAQLIDDLLDVSRIVAGKMRLEVCPLDLPPIIEAAVEAVRPAAEAKNIRLQLTLDTESGLVLGDAGRLQQVIWNLVSNAVKFTPEDGRVQIVLARLDSHVEVAVSDTGEGIHPDFLPHMFERFRQADSSSSRVHGGLGLGLAIVRHIVELHGGTVRAESAGPGTGATFTVNLPRQTLARRAGESTHRHPTLTKPLALQDYPSLAGLQVLVVDDEPDSNEVIGALLTEHGAHVRAAASAEHALGQLDGWKADVIVSDVGMPGHDGYWLMAELQRRAAELGSIPVVALTAYATTEDRVRLLSAGFHMHVPKPIEPAELVTVVSRVARTAGRL